MMARFATSARAVDMLGRQQIASVPTAISELFKNAFDAYANEVRADYFVDRRLFALRDDGVGMSESDFKTRWLTLATDSKARNSLQAPPPRPPGALVRPTMGEKGIGRLAIATLGPLLLVISRSITASEADTKEPSIVVALVPWSLFEVPGLVLDDVDIPVVTVGGPEQIDTELMQSFREHVERNLRRVEHLVPDDLLAKIKSELTALELDPQSLLQMPGPGLRDDSHGTTFLVLGTGDDLSAALSQTGEQASNSATPLERLLIGFMDTMLPGRPAPPMRARFIVHERGRPARDIIAPDSFWTPEDFRSLDHDISGVFDEFGRFEGTVSVYQQPPVACEIPWPGGTKGRSRCGSFRIRLGYIQGNARESQLDDQTYLAMSKKLERFGGLYIYRDGIRVQPYGSVDVDYLRIEERRSRRASRYYFSYRRMFGAIEIGTEENGDLQDKASREGLRENGAYRDFRAILENFFIQLAADYFNAGGQQSLDWQEYRQQLRDTSAARKELDTRRRKLQADFQDRLDAALKYLEDGDLRADVDGLVNELEHRLRGRTLDSNGLASIELWARESLEAFSARMHLDPPHDVGLTVEQRRDLVAYRGLLQRAQTETIPDAANRVVEMIDSATSATLRDELTTTRMKFTEHATALVAQTARNLDADARDEANRLSDYVVNLGRSAVTSVEGLVRTAGDSLKRALTEQDRQAILSDLNAAAESQTDRLREVAGEIAAIIEGRALAENILLQEQVLDLQNQIDANLELLLLGQAVQVIDHELEATVTSVRNGLRSLRAAARQDGRLSRRVSDTTNAFEHLDGYLRLFTPMQRRLYRRRSTITGEYLAGYVSRVFADRIARHGLTIEATSSFRTAQIHGFPSTFLPVLINVVDNAIYWLSNSRPDGGLIVLDRRDDSLLVVDNGPGIRERDREAVFQRGFSRKPSGRGLGLAISREALEREDPPWTLALAQPQPDNGAAFAIRPGKYTEEK